MRSIVAAKYMLPVLLMRRLSRRMCRKDTSFDPGGGGGRWAPERHRYRLRSASRLVRELEGALRRVIANRAWLSSVIDTGCATRVGTSE
jgi:hypothetical protein